MTEADNTRLVDEHWLLQRFAVDADWLRTIFADWDKLIDDDRMTCWIHVLGESQSGVIVFLFFTSPREISIKTPNGTMHFEGQSSLTRWQLKLLLKVWGIEVSA